MSVYTTNASNQLIATTTINAFGTGPIDAAVRGDQAFAYVTSTTTNQIRVIDTATQTVVQTMATGTTPFGVTVSADGTRVYVANRASNTVSVYAADARTGQLTATATISTGAGSGPRITALSSDGSRLYVVDQNQNKISVVDTGTNTVTGTIPVGTQPVGIAVNPSGTRVYVTNFTDNSVSVIDTGSNTVVATVPAGAGTGPAGVTVSPDGTHFYVTLLSSDQVARFDAATNTLSSNVGLGAGNSSPIGIAMNADGSALFATNAGSNNISMYKVNSGTGALTINGTIATGTNPQLPGMCGNGNAMLASGGTFVANTAGALGCTGGTASFTGGTLVINGASLSIATPVALGSGGGIVDTNGNDATFTTAVTGAGGLTKTGVGTLSLSGANLYTGGTTVSAGTLLLLSGASLASTGALTITGGTFDLGGNAQTVASLSGTGGSVALSGGALTVNQSANTSFAGTITGAGTLTKSGIGTLTLTGANTYLGGTTITGGTLNANTDAALGDSAGGLTLAGGTLQWAASFNPASTRTITLGSGGGTFDTNGFTGGIGSNVTGSGGLTKSGAGTLQLAGANNYTGGTTVNAGTLQLVSGASLAATGAVTVNGGTLDFDGNTQTIGSLSGTGGTITLGPGGSIGGLTVNQSSNTSYNGNITGTGSFTKAGTGTLVLNGVNNFTGGTTVSAGTLEIGDASHTGASLAGAVTVGASGALMGHGTLSGDLNNTTGGTVTPGGSIGTLTVNGNYTQSASSTLAIEVSPSAASKLVATGTASLAGTLRLIYDPGVYTSKTFTIVSAGSVIGTFSTVTGNTPADIGQTLVYGGNSVNLMLTSLTVAPSDATVYTALGTTAIDAAQAANDTLLAHVGTGQGAAASAAQDTVLADRNPTQLAFNGRVAALNELTAQLPETVARYGGWYQALGRFASLNGSASVPGFDTRSGGFLAGIDRPIGENLIAGIAAGYSHTDLSEHDGESGTIDTPRIALYGSYRLGAFALDTAIGYAHDFIDAVRPIAATGETASSSHGGNEATAAMQAKLRLEARGVTLTPKAGFQYVHLFEDGYSESGSPGFDLVGARRNSDSLRPFIGASAARTFITDGGVTLTPRLDLTYSHEVMNAAPASSVQVGGGSFSINGLVPSRDRVILGGGISATMSDRLALYADYRATLPTGNTFSQTVEAGLRLRF